MAITMTGRSPRVNGTDDGRVGSVSADRGDLDEWRWVAAEALREALLAWRGDLRPLAEELVEYLGSMLRRGDGSQIGALAVPRAVHVGLRGTDPPDWLMAAASATYLAWDLLDDDMDGDPVKFWRGRPAADRTIGAHLLLATAVAQAPLHAGPAGSAGLTRLYLDMVSTVTEGQLRAEVPLHVGTTPEAVAAGNDARSGAMLAGLAELAANVAGAGGPTCRAAARFGRELALARQLVNDLTELASPRTSDLRNRTATMPAAFALQRTPPADRAALVRRLQAAATDADLRRRMVDRDLRPALADTRMLARLHLAEAIRLAGSFARRTRGRAAVRSLIDYTASGFPVSGDGRSAPAGSAVAWK